AMAGDSLFALIQGAPAETANGDDPPMRGDLFLMLREGATRWAPARLPPGWSTGAPARLLARESSLVLMQEGSAWQAAAPAAIHGVDGAWAPLALDAPLDDACFVAAGGSIVTARAEPGRVSLSLLRDGASVPLGVLDRDILEYAVVGGGDHATVIWRGEGDPMRLRATVFSAISGDVLFDDFARTNAVVSGREIQSL